jgi:SAM-dependent methyltransferase
MKYIKTYNIFESKDVGLSNIVYKNILKDFKNYDVYKSYGYADIRKLDSVSNIKLPFSEKTYMNMASKIYSDKYTKDGEFINYDVDGDYEYTYEIDDYSANHEIYSEYNNLKILKYIKDISGSKLKLCDLGCGIGTLLYFSKKIGYDVFGVEYQKELKSIHDSLGIDVVYGDFFKIDMSFLSKFDVIYLYRPIENKNKMKELINLIFNHMKKDAIIVYSYPYDVDDDRFNILGSSHDQFIMTKK